MKKKLGFSSLLIGGVFILSACGRGDITPTSTGLWEQFVYLFAQAIHALAFGGQTWVGIVLFTLFIRIVLLPLFNWQMKSSQEMQNLQPKLKELQSQYAGTDTDSRMQFAQAQQALFKEHGVNPYASMLPLAIQLPVLLGLYQALTRVESLQSGSFLWMALAQPDPYFVLPILAAILTFISSWLSTKSVVEKNGALQAMTYLMPFVILLFGATIASGVALYWTVSNAFQVFQILVFNNPFKIIAEREAKRQAEKEQEAKRRKAKKKASKRRK